MYHAIYTILFVFIFTSLIHCQTYPTAETRNAAVADIYKVIEDTKVVDKRGRAQYPFIAGFVRLAFHDCVGNGKCDGCIDHNLGDNSGLKGYTDVLDAIYDSNYKPNNLMSRADFYALSSLVALTNATVNVADKFEGLKLFKGGRIDCLNSPAETTDDNPNFPMGEFNNSQVLDFFNNEFGFNAQESVALMGAHTLGRCHIEFSGYEGPWVNGRDPDTGYTKADLLNNEYHEQIRGNWEQVKLSSGKIQWQRLNTAPNVDTEDNNQENMFLNADMAIAWDINPTKTGQVTCQIGCNNKEIKINPSCCLKPQETRNPWQRYINSNSEWLSDFTTVFMKMINMNTNEHLLEPQEGTDKDYKMEEIFNLINEVAQDIKTIKNDLI